MKTDIATTMRVGSGSSAPSEMNSVANTGMTFQRMMYTTRMAMAITAAG